MTVATRLDVLNASPSGYPVAPTLRTDLLETGKQWGADYIIDVDIDEERSGAQLTALVIERATNAERRLERISFDDPAGAVRTLVERIATDSIMTKRLRDDGCYQVRFEFQVDREAELIPSSRKLPVQSAYGEGEVLAQFVVDTSGAVVLKTFKSLKATHGEMVRELLEDLPNWRFTPASTRRCGLVSQLVQIPIQRRKP